jgi:adenylate cyclase
MTLSPERILKIKQLGIIILYWMIMLRVLVLLNFLGVALVPEEIQQSKFIHIIRDNFWATTCAGFAIGLCTGISELYLFPAYLKNKTLIKVLLGKIFIYLGSVMLISVITTFIYNKTKGFSNAEALMAVGELLSTNGFYYIFSATLMLSFGLNFYLIVQNKIGVNNFFPVISGKYYYPREENRIFLFLDLKSSSVMAEQLGHKKYSQMLQGCYKDLSELVIKYRGTIYQFVGDEAVITWKTPGRKDFKNSIALFFAFTNNLQKNAEYFQNKFGLVPEFKGAINAGNVMTAEVGGYLKSEIAHHGDVLNTAARMLELAKSFPNKLIVSSAVKENLQQEICNYTITSKGKIKLRGKNNTKDIYLISEN